MNNVFPYSTLHELPGYYRRFINMLHDLIDADPDILWTRGSDGRTDRTHVCANQRAKIVGALFHIQGWSRNEIAAAFDRNHNFSCFALDRFHRMEIVDQAAWLMAATRQWNLLTHSAARRIA